MPWPSRLLKFGWGFFVLVRAPPQDAACTCFVHGWVRVRAWLGLG
jgi:hypothetical protein